MSATFNDIMNMAIASDKQKEAVIVPEESSHESSRTRAAFIAQCCNCTWREVNQNEACSYLEQDDLITGEVKRLTWKQFIGRATAEYPNHHIETLRQHMLVLLSRKITEYKETHFPNSNFILYRELPVFAFPIFSDDDSYNKELVYETALATLYTRLMFLER
jgi:hypothetical protein